MFTTYLSISTPVSAAGILIAMDLTFILILAGAGAMAVILWFLVRSRGKETEDRPFVLIQNQLNELSRLMDTRLGESARAMQYQFGESLKIVREVTEKLTKVDETNRQVVNFASELQNLQNILKNPKQRGILGEYYLETVLKNVLPPGAFQMQYGFKDGAVVDAAVFVGGKIIPVDSKFSLENYNRLLQAKDDSERARFESVLREDLKNRIDETSKYVRPDEKTMEFAFMFIPSEAVYYDLLINKVGSVSARDLIEYAFSKKVIIVSPTSFLAYLQTVLQGLRALQIEESAKEIRKRVEDLGRHLSGYEIFMKKLGSSLGTVVGAYNQAYKEFGKVDKDIMKVSGESSGILPETLEKPEIETERDS